jgi:uncharacterized membrane protein HdeD (DUF308 family)
VVVAAIADHAGDFWWLSLIAGLVELLLGFWSAGYFGHAEVLLIVWVGAVALTRAIVDVVEAFAIRQLR